MGHRKMNKLFNIFTKYKLIALIIFFCTLIIIIIFYVNQLNNSFYLTAKFSNSGPLYANIPVYFKGYRIGKVRSVKLSEDYKYTFADIVIYKKDPILSSDVVAKVKNHDIIKEYVDLTIPDEASTTILKNKSVIDGEPLFDLDSFLSDIANADIIVPLLQTFSDTLTSFNKTSIEINGFFADSRSILKDNKNNINQATKELAQSSKNLRKLTARINSSISKEKINNTTSNMSKSSDNVLTATENVKRITENIDNATKNLDKTVAKIDCTMSKADKISDNVKAITCGLRETLEKRFAGLKIFFGKPIKNKCTKECCK